MFKAIVAGFRGILLPQKIGHLAVPGIIHTGNTILVDLGDIHIEFKCIR